ncbi:MAG TPA: winged helix-turn-helix domain-containing protein [Stellaceae bacterium]|nr:winged helix-turn-helix domain-containing protein [Stellaceae bacterium]
MPLGSRALDILCALALAKGEIVGKDELMTRVWPGLVVEENNIQVHVSALRKALEDGKSGETHIVTVPGRGYRLAGLKRSLSGGDAGQQRSLEPASSEKASIAVLPFHNMSGDPEQDYFADGMVEEIITGLSRIKWLSVISRNSSFIYKGKPVAIGEVADKFGVRYVLEGSVRKSGNRIRTTAQLIDAKTDAHLWAEQYERVLDDVFALQDEITMCVVGAIEPSLRKAELDRVKRQRPRNLNAYDLVLRSLPFVLAHIPKDSEPAIPLLEEALTLQPDYAAAHAFLARCLHHRYARAGLREEDRLAAIRHARAAILQGNDDATALATAAHIIALDEHDAVTALKLFDRALELSNSNTFALNFSAVILAWMGKTELAVERAERALRLNPFDLENFRVHHALAIVHFCRKQYADALAAARSAIHANPGFSTARAVLAAALWRAGHPTEAKAAAREVLVHEPQFSIRGVGRVPGGLEPTVFERFAEAWREIGLPE